MRFDRKVSLKLAIALMLIAILVSSSVTYYVFAVVPTSTFTISPGVYPGAPSYTVWVEGSNYFAKDANGVLKYTGSDVAAIINICLANANGGLVRLNEGVYSIKSSIIINKNGTHLEGVGTSREQPFFPSVADPLKRITVGTVLRIDTSGIDGIKVLGKLMGISIKNIAIDFSVSSTGHGINSVCYSDVGISEFNIEDIVVNNNDASHYALRMENPCLGTVTRLTCYGGGLLEVLSVSTVPTCGIDFNCGNIVFTQITGWLTKNITTPAIYLDRINGTGWINLCIFNRAFVISNIGTYAASEALKIGWLKDSQFNMLNLEVWYVSPIDVVRMGQVHTTTFVNPYIMYSPSGGWMAWNDTSHILVIGGIVDVTVADYGNDNQWYSVSIHEISSYNVAYLDKCYLWNGTAFKPTYNVGMAYIHEGVSAIFEHGLAVAPQFVFVSFNVTGWGSYSWVADDTNIAIELENSGNYTLYWMAFCQPYM